MESRRFAPLGAKWYWRVVDVCGLRRPEGRVEVFLTHNHSDHRILPSELRGFKVNIWTPNEALRSIIQRTYPWARVEIWRDTLRLQHTSLVRGRFEKTDAHGYFVDRALVIPECDNPLEVVREYRERINILMVFRRSPRFCVSRIPVEEVDYLLDPSRWFFENREPKVIPKVFFSSTPQDRELFERMRVGGKSILYLPRLFKGMCVTSL